MTPLQWPTFFQRPDRSSWIKQLFMPDRNYAQVTEHLKRQLLTRSHPDPMVWGEDPKRSEIASVVCKRIQEEYSWPNDHFLPNDPCDIVFLTPWDDLESVELAMQLEEDLGIHLEDAEVASWGGTLSNVVDMLFAKHKVQSTK